MVVDDKGIKLNEIELLNLEDMSIEALNDYIIKLNSEIKRAQSEIISKENARLGAEKVFK